MSFWPEFAGTLGWARSRKVEHLFIDERTEGTHYYNAEATMIQSLNKIPGNKQTGQE